MTVCTIIAKSVAMDSTTDYKGSMEDLIRTVLDRI